MAELRPIATPLLAAKAFGVCLPRAKGRPKCEVVRSMAACFLSKLSTGSFAGFRGRVPWRFLFSPH